MYLADFRRYPINWEVPLTDISSDGSQIESGCLMPYLSQNHKVFYCPVQEESPVRRWSPGDDDRLSGYALNQNGTAMSGQARLGLGLGTPPREVHEEMVRCPADMIAYGDVFTGAVDLSPHGTNQLIWGGVSALVMGIPSSRHLGGANVLFCDGHVAFQKQAQWIMATDQAMCRWNNDHESHRETW
jgi:prepilin-type processing-associated H-X9-DG protein